MRNRFQKSLHALLVVLLISNLTAANCFVTTQKITFAKQPNTQTVLNLTSLTRAQITNELKSRGVPAFLKQTLNGEIPVILLNNETYPKVKELIHASFGTHVYLQPQWNNDHGGIRLGENLIDADTPGYRGYGELNENGLAWKNLNTYLTLRDQTIIETGFLLTLEERKAVEFYQLIRRAALYRVPFTFGGRGGAAHPDLLTRGENCFCFSKGSAVSSHKTEILSRLEALGIKDLNAFMNLPNVRKYLITVKNKTLDSDPNSSEEMTSEHIVKSGDVNHIKTVLNDLKIEQDPNKVAQWLISYVATAEYETLLQTLGVRGGTGFDDMHSRRASFVFIYDSNEKSNEFISAQYTAKGIFNTWHNQNQRGIE